MTVRLRGRLPAEEMNGLEKHEQEFSANPTTKRIVVGVIDVYERRDHHGDGDFQPTVEFVQIEVLDGKFRERGVKLLQAAYGKRTGSRQLAGFEDDALDEDGEPTQPSLPKSPPRGDVFTFEPLGDGKWSLRLQNPDGATLGRRMGLAVRSELTLGLEYTLDEIDAFDDGDLSALARIMVQDAADAEFDAADPERSQYVGPDGVDEAAEFGEEIPLTGPADEKETQDA